MSSYARDERIQKELISEFRKYEETHFIHMMYKLFSPKFLPVF
jgi:hypothetical protein